MRFLGFDITRARRKALSLSTVPDRGTWITVFDGPGGWFQQDYQPTGDSVLSFHAVYACITLIAADIGKMRFRLMQHDATAGIWTETESASFSPVLRKPNGYQNHIQFKEWWMLSKLARGNAYALLQRDSRGVVAAMYLLDPTRVTPLVTPSGDVYYRLGQDNLSGIDDGSTVVPASEIIHDRMNCLFHPLVGTSPIFACGVAAVQGLKIQANQTKFFANASLPGGVLTSPGELKDDQSKRYKDRWKEMYTGDKVGDIAVLGSGIKFEPLRMTAVDSQLIEQLKMSAEIVCSTFHVPGFMVGVGSEPAYANGETRTQHYYSQCLQAHIEAMETCLDEGLGLDTKKAGTRLGVELDLDGLLRMDTSSLVTTLKEGIGGSLFSPNEGRRRVNLPPVAGGDQPLAQQQYFSLRDIANRQPPTALPPPPDAPVKPAGQQGDAKASERYRERRHALRWKEAA
jgi:HK97 family phage portal protein